MNYYNNPESIKELNTSIALGKFDGLHKGHSLLINEVIRYADEYGLSRGVFTFDESMIRLIGEDNGMIYGIKEREYFFEKMGLDFVASYTFDDHLMSMEPEKFVKNILVDTLNAKAISVGEEFRFGHNRRGDAALLQELSSKYGYHLTIIAKCIDETLEENNKVSSSTIRNYLKAGNIAAANKLLGRNYSLMGEVIHGRALGRTIGIPTTNVRLPEYKLSLPHGVYVTKNYVLGDDEKAPDNFYMGVTNVGMRPTVNGHHLQSETYLLDFKGDIYGRTLYTEFIDYIRSEMKFDDVEQLKAQIVNDIEQVKGYKLD